MSFETTTQFVCLRQACKTTLVSASTWLHIKKIWSFCSATWNIFLSFVKIIVTLIILENIYGLDICWVGQSVLACFQCFERKASSHSTETFFDINSLNKHVFSFSSVSPCIIFVTESVRIDYVFQNSKDWGLSASHGTITFIIWSNHFS